MGELAERLARGDRAAFAELYDALAHRLHHFLTTSLGSRDAADDVVQETFVRLVRLRHQLRKVENVPAYVFQIARNEASRQAARGSRTARREVRLRATDLFADASDKDRQRQETTEMVAASLSRLTPDQREVAELRIYAGLTFREIAEVVGVPLPTAASRYRSALLRLREWFARQSS
jgi:RNA polymerase sigma-70 factor (ECF subfamily)